MVRLLSRLVVGQKYTLYYIAVWICGLQSRMTFFERNFASDIIKKEI